MIEILFGNATAEKALLYLANYEQGYANGIARTFGMSASQVTKQLLRLESGGVLVSRELGKTRLFEFNPRFAFKNELLALLRKAISFMSEEETQQFYRQRRRPRRTGKKL